MFLAGDTTPFADFQEASKAVLQHLAEVLDFDLLMVTRTEGDDWIVLQAADRGYDVAEGSIFRWSDSFCSRMVLGMGPHIAPSASEIPVYAAAPIGQQVPIGAYVGVPLKRHDGELFGTLCAIHPTAKSPEIVENLPEVKLLARLLCSMLQMELRATEESRRAERAQLDAMVDSLTGLYNRRGWDQLLAAEEARCRRYGHSACLISVDINFLKTVNDTQGHSQGDLLIQRAAEAIKSTLRTPDVVARLGGDEFAILAVECDRAGSLDLMARLQNAFSSRDVSASVGLAMCKSNTPFAETWNLADEAMYEHKRSRRQVTSGRTAGISLERRPRHVDLLSR